VTTPPFDCVTGDDIETVSKQLKRPVRNVIGIAARTRTGEPTVVATAPRLSDGTPFPTLYYLCHPDAIAAISQLEAVGTMSELSELLAARCDLQEAYRRAHEAYLMDRNGIEFIEEIDDFSAGGMPTRIKCLHALAAHALATGPGVNPIGDIALERANWKP
jgi:hypothetical protein